MASSAVVEADAPHDCIRHVGRRQGFSPYPKYKPSGVEWLGDVPEHWEVRPLKYSAALTMGQSPPGNAVHDSPAGLPFLQGCAEFGSDHPVPIHYCRNPPRVAPSRSTLMSVRAPVGTLNVADQDYGIGRGLCAIQPGPRWHDRFAYWQLHILCDVLAMSATGSTYDAVSVGDIASLNLLLPLSEEQRAIAAYLDRETAKVDALIARNEALIKHLKEQRAALVSRTVTRGLPPDESRKAGIDPHPKLKPSGVEWLGDVPEHWEVAPVKRHYDVRLGKMLQADPNTSSDRQVAYLKAKHVQWFAIQATDLPRMWASHRDMDHFSIRKGDLLVCEGGEGGRSAVVKAIAGRHIIQNALHRVRPRDGSSNVWLQYVLCVAASTGLLEAISSKATIAHFTADKFNALMIPMPRPAEVNVLVTYLDRETAKIERATKFARRESSLLREYRTRLISDVVTGKVDIRRAGSVQAACSLGR